ncbi:hypothetical protein AB0B51_38065, partial [Streptomyces griseus]|uniref:hypothetical protein n=1 Tax=Streptomyces griseus TaxID=1911 RepID=UPI0033C06665
IGLLTNVLIAFFLALAIEPAVGRMAARGMRRPRRRALRARQVCARARARTSFRTARPSGRVRPATALPLENRAAVERTERTGKSESTHRQELETILSGLLAGARH